VILQGPVFTPDLTRVWREYNCVSVAYTMDIMFR